MICPLWHGLGDLREVAGYSTRYSMSRRKNAAIVLAAGKGARMRSDMPKVLHPIAGRPMIAYVIEALEKLSIDKIIVVVGPKMDAVVEAVAPYPCIIQERPLGTAHAVLVTEPALKNFDGDVLVINGADPLVLPSTLRKLLRTRSRPSNPALVALGFYTKEPGEILKS